MGEAGGHFGGAIVVEAHAIYECPAFGVAEKSGTGIARLSLGRDRAYLNMSKAEGGESPWKLATLVHSCGQTDSVGEFQSEEAHRLGLSLTGASSQKNPERRAGTKNTEARARQTMGLFRIHGEEERAHEVFVEGSHPYRKIV